MAIPPQDARASAPRLVVPAGRGKVEMREPGYYYPELIDKSNLPG